MTVKLTDAELDQLESWIGTGPKTFTLLYSITRDGCDAKVFHQTCDNQGPTVTVLYNQQQSVYGGYTSENWKGSSVYVKDEKAFLYQLRFSGNNKYNKFPCKSPTHAILPLPSYGPIFGSGNDMITFNGIIKNSGGSFALNGYMNSLGTSYDTSGVTADNVNNGNMKVTELEVYRVTDGKRQTTTVTPERKPWRKTPELNEQYLVKLIEELQNIKPMSDVDISEFRILMLGPVGSGKSSFYNTIDSIFRGRISHRAVCGTTEHSITTAYTPYQVRTKTGSTLKFLLCDTRGLEETQGPDVSECNFLIDGHIPDFYEIGCPYSGLIIKIKVLKGQKTSEVDIILLPKYKIPFNPAKAITMKSSEFVLKPANSNVVHCVAFVIDASTVNTIPAKMMDRINRFSTQINQRKIPRAVLLTNVDKLSESVHENVTSAFTSKGVEQAVNKVADLFGLPRNSVCPVKNYENEQHLDNNVSMLALMALQQLLYMAEDYTETLASKLKQEPRMDSAHGVSEQDVTESDTA